MLGKEAFTQKNEEYKELGHECRYRDQLMVQEFSLSIVAVGVLINVITARLGTVVAVIIQVLGFFPLLILALHLRNTNQDRVAALSRREVLRKELGFGLVHQNVDGNRRQSAPELMPWVTVVIALTWAIWTAVSASPLFSN